MESTEEELKRKIKAGLITNDLEPIKCICGSEEYRDVTTDKIDYMEVEKKRICNKCEDYMGHWAYGYWQP